MLLYYHKIIPIIRDFDYNLRDRLKVGHHPLEVAILVRVQVPQPIMSYYVYVLKSLKDGIRYVGSGENPFERLRRHNKGDYRFTKGHRPWQLIYQENCKNRSEAMKREKFLKSGQGRNWLDNILK